MIEPILMKYFLLTLRVSQDHTLAASLHAISHFKVAQAVPKEGSISLAELARATGLTELDVARFVRRTAINHIFVEPTHSHFSPSICGSTDAGTSCSYVRRSLSCIG
jgi:hypothetical protein